MADQSRLKYGLEKLNNALEAFEASIAQFNKEKKSEQARIFEIEQLKQQNAELSEELALLKSKSTVLEEANKEVSERLDGVVDSISDVLRAV